MAREHRSFAEFWPLYLREHSKPGTRALHEPELRDALRGRDG